MIDILGFLAEAWWLPIGLAAGIASGAYWSFRTFKGKIAPLKRALTQLAQTLERIQDSKAFLAQYETLTAKLADDPYLGGVWVEYEATLILPKEAGLIRNTRRPSEFFNNGLYYKAGINLRSFEAAPNQLVGIGLFLTFLGLVLALWVAKRGIGEDIETAKNSLRQLLDAAAFKFTTSLAALGCSVIYLWRKNDTLHEIDDLVERICRELERVTVQTTGEALADASHGELVRQTAELERFNSELAISIAEALDGKLRQSLELAMEPVASEIGKLAERMGELNKDALGQMVAKFSSELSGAAREHTDQLARLMESAAGSIAQVPELIDAAAQKFSEQIEAGAEELSASMTAAAENVDATLQGSAHGLGEAVEASAEGFRDILAHIETSNERQQTFAENLARTEGAIAGRMEAVLTSAEKIGVQLATLAAQVEAAAVAAAGLDDVSEAVKAASSALRGAIDQVDHLTERAENLNEDAQNTLERLVVQVTQLEREMASMNTALAGAFDKVASGVAQFGDKTTSFVAGMDKALADAIGRLSAAIAELDEVLDTMPKKTDFNQLTRAIRDAGRGSAE